MDREFLLDGEKFGVREMAVEKLKSQDHCDVCFKVLARH